MNMLMTQESVCLIFTFFYSFLGWGEEEGSIGVGQKSMLGRGDNVLYPIIIKPLTFGGVCYFIFS